MPLAFQMGTFATLPHYAVNTCTTGNNFFVWENTDGVGKCSAWMEKNSDYAALEKAYMKDDKAEFSRLASELVERNPFNPMPKDTPFNDFWINNESSKGKSK